MIFFSIRIFALLYAAIPLILCFQKYQYGFKGYYYINVFFFGLGCLTWSTWLVVYSTFLTLPKKNHEILCRNLTCNMFKGLCNMFCNKLQIIGKENITNDEPCIYVANHQSLVDCIIFFLLPFEKTLIVSKSSVKFLPGLGILIYFINTIFINRKNKSSRNEFYEKAHRQLKNGNSIHLYPQGTRQYTSSDNFNISSTLPFKVGAFKLAKIANVPIIPYTIIYQDNITKVIIHQKIQTQKIKSMELEDLIAETRHIIYSAL